MSNINHSESDNIIGNIKIPNFAAWLKAQSECLESIDAAIAEGKREMLVHAATGFGKTTLYRRIIKASKGPCWINLPSTGSKEILSKDLDIQSPKHLIDLDNMNEDFLSALIDNITKDSVILCTYSLLNQIHKASPELFDKLMNKLGSFDHPAQIHSDEAHRGIGKQTIMALKQMTKEREELGEEVDNSDEIEKAAQEFDEEERDYDDTISEIIHKNKNIYNICRTATPTYSHKSVKNHFPTVFTFTKQQALEIGVSVPVKNIPLGEGIQYISKENYTERDLMNGTDRYFISKKVETENGEYEDKLFRADELIPQTVADLHKISPVKAIGVGANIDHLYELEKTYNLSGIRTYIVHSTNKKHKASGSLIEAKKLMESGQIDMILVCNTGIELLDIPTLNLGVMHYSPHSPVKLNQFIGRIDRSNEGKEFTRLICPPTKIIYEPKEATDSKEISEDKGTSVSSTVGKLRREDTYYTLGDFTIEYLEANGLTYLQIYKDYLDSQKSKRELLESTRQMIRKSFQNKTLMRNIEAAKEIYEVCNLGDSDNIDRWLNDCRDLIAMNKIWMYSDNLRTVRLGGKSIRFTKNSKFDEEDIAEEVKSHIGDNPLIHEYKWDDLTKHNMSEYVINLENLRNEYEEANNIVTIRPTGGINSGIGITNRNIANGTKYRSFLKNPVVLKYSNKLVELVLPYIVYIVKSFEKNVIENSESSSFQSDDYISICLEFFLNNIALYQNVSHTTITQRTSSMTMDIIMDNVIDNNKYGINNEGYIKDTNYIKNRDKEANGEFDNEFNKVYKAKKAHIEEYTSGRLNSDEIEHSFGFEKFYDEDLRIEISKAISSLTQREEEVICLYFGLNGYRENNIEEYQNILNNSLNKTGEISESKFSHLVIEYIGAKFNFTNTRVFQILDKAIRRLRQTARCKLLKEYVGGQNEENYIIPYRIPHKTDGDRNPIIPEVLKGDIYDESELTIESENSFDSLYGSMIRERLMDNIKLNFPTNITKDHTQRYTYLAIYDYLIGYQNNLTYDMKKAILQQFDSHGFINIVKEANIVRKTKRLDPLRAYDLFNDYRWFDLLAHQSFVKLSDNDYKDIKRYIYCEEYPKYEKIPFTAKVELDKLLKLEIIGAKLLSTRNNKLQIAQKNKSAEDLKNNSQKMKLTGSSTSKMNTLLEDMLKIIKG